MQPIELKIAYIGGGSREWARKLMFDLALCPDLTGNVALYDIDAESARLNERFGNWLQEQPNVVSRWRHETVGSLDEALRGADFVVLSIQPGTLEIMADEIAIAEKHGMFFPVGDTTGAPGLVRGLRCATIYQEFAHRIAAMCPQAWVINYTNPMTICTRTLTRVEPKLKVFGCCHEVFSTQRLLGSLAEKYLNVSPAPSRHEIQVNVLGINHFTWIDRSSYREVDLLDLVKRYMAEPGVVRDYTQAEVESWHDWFRSVHQVKFELFKRFGILAAAGDRHLVEFMPGYTRSPEELFRWGIIRTPVSYRIERWRTAPQKTTDLMEGRTPLVLDASGEEGVAQMRALLGLGDLVTNVNVENVGQVSNLPLHAVVETNARFSRNSVQPLVAGALPLGVHSIIARHVANQEMIVDAALTCDADMAYQAVLNDPTNRLPTDEAREMFDEMLRASREFLPGWKIP
ncbi:MAG: alpha-glucosidase/alpha-galactosidase [Chloroflexi bacterium]|nr:alpha-glucosidase/alpha-galactosidase [Chloroflexota bacterium]